MGRKEDSPDAAELEQLFVDIDDSLEAFLEVFPSRGDDGPQRASVGQGSAGGDSRAAFGDEGVQVLRADADSV